MKYIELICLDCLECMACSDNVVRAGLTPKYKDIKTLCDMLNYSFMSAEDVLFKFESHPEDPYIKIYNPPVDEFTVSKIQVIEYFSLTIF